MKIKSCRSCSSSDLELVINLGKQPWGNDFRTSENYQNVPRFPLEVAFCNDCFLLQLNYTVPKEYMFLSHTYVSGSTKTLRDHFLSNAEEAISIWKSGNSVGKLNVLDIGSNDGTQLLQFKELGAHVKGVESASNIAEIAKKSGIDTDIAFFNEKYADKSGSKYSIINASGVFFHLEELHSATRAVKKLLDRGGVFVVQFIYLKEMIEKLAFDQIYHEHLLYYLFTTLNTLLKGHGLEIFHGNIKPIHGGSGIAYVCHEGERPISEEMVEIYDRENSENYLTGFRYKKFMEDVLEFKKQNLQFIDSCKKKGKIIYGLGAPVKGNTLLNFFGLTSNDIQALTEINELRRGCYAPGSGIPIIIEDENLVQPDVYYVLAWNFKNEIQKRYADKIADGVEFYFPIQVND